MARHPSESEAYLLTRVLAYALEYEEGIEFSRGGVSDAEDPPLAIRDLTGAYRAWIEIGTPEPARLHRASKAAPRVAVYVHKDPSQWLARLSGERIHKSDAIACWAIDRGFLDELVAALERRMTFSLSVTDRELFVALGSSTLAGTVTRLALN